ncbi:MAG: right-handed parallel beta-helix repeat-containing protein [Candidatus Hydrogenedentes bacterium]|nr:right-handed parallel beta-helix repeat-containing protein [Candidatus Hydrogenedentota bacterium]
MTAVPFRTLTLCALLGVLCISAHTEVLFKPSGPVFFVAPDGNDSWSGKIPSPASDGSDGPFATLQAGRDAVRAMRLAGDLKDDEATVYIHGGDYALSETLVFTPEDHSTTYAAYNGTPVIHGARKLTGFQVDGNLWALDLPDVAAGNWAFSALWVNGERRQPARTPNPANPDGDYPPDTDFFRTAGPVIEKNEKGEDVKSATKVHFNPEDLKQFATLDDAVFVIFHSWATSLLRVKSVDTENNILEFTGPARWHFGYWQPNQRYFIQNVREGLDQPGEWYLDKKAGKLLYYPLPGEDPATAQVYAPVLEKLVVLQGDAAQDQLVNDLDFKELQFSYTEYGIAPEGHSDAQAAFKVSGAIETYGARFCDFDRCTLSHLGNYGFWFHTGSQYNEVRQCEITDLGAGGVRIGEGGNPGSDDEAAGKITLDNCFIHNGGRMFRSAVGVWIGRSSYNNITHNEICDFRYTGVSVGWSWGYEESSANHNLIGDNHIHHIGLGQLNDMGGIYTLGISPGTVLSGNHIHAVHSHPELYGGWGLYTDEGSSYIVLENNLVYDTRTGTFHQHYGRENKVINNILAYSHTPQIVRSREEDHISFYFERNIVFYNNDNLLGSTWKNDQWVMDHNIYWDEADGEVDFQGQSLVEWQARGHDTHSVIADPLFVDPHSANFNLQPDSPALDLGFKPFPLDQAGLYGDKEWVEKPKQIERKAFTPPESAGKTE